MSTTLRLALFPAFLAVLALASSRAFAGDEDAATSAADRYHDAYVAEVIDGDVAKAAKGYLALIDDPATPPDIRAEARLRFAIVAVLLGRADEARLRLGGLVADADVPDAVKERARAVLASIADVAAGSELDKKLQSLVFDLARVSPYEPSPAVYRDFEVLGARALPFLRKLLHHEDPGLRRHAFRLLVRMGEPGMGEAWTASIRVYGPAWWSEWISYLAKRPDEVRAWEASLLALDDDGVRTQLEDAMKQGWWPAYPPFSLAFVEALAARPALRDLAFHHLVGVRDETSKWATVDRWLASEDQDLASETASWILEHSTGGPTDEGARARWPKVFASTLARGEGFSPTTAPAGSTSGNLLAYLRRLPTDTLLADLEQLTKPGGTQGPNPLNDGFASSIARVLDERDMDGKALARYGLVLRNWLDAWAAGMAGPADARTAWKQALPWLQGHVRRYLEQAKPDEAAAFLDHLFQGPANGRAQDFAPVLAIRSPDDMERFMAVLHVVGAAERSALVPELPDLDDSGAELRLAILERLPEMVRLVGPGNLLSQLQDVPHASRGLSPDASRGLAAEILGALLSSGRGSGKWVTEQLHRWITNGQVTQRQIGADYVASMALPGLDAQWTAIAPEDRTAILDWLWHALDDYVGAVVWTDRLSVESRAALRAFLLEHLDDISDATWKVVGRFPQLVPPEAWLRTAPERMISYLQVTSDEADRIAREVARRFAAGEDRPTATILAFVQTKASEAVGRDVFDALLRSPDPAVRNLAIARLSRGGTPASPEAMKDAQDLLLAETSPDLWVGLMLARRRIEAHPTKDLFPLIRRLLSAEDPGILKPTIGLAKDLGQPELIPALVPFLESLDRSLRQAAREAIQAIREVVTLEHEEKLRAAGFLPQGESTGGR